MKRLFDTSKLTSLEEAKTVLLFDTSNLAFAAANSSAYSYLAKGRGKKKGDETLSGHIFGSFQKVLSIYEKLSYENTALVFALDEFPKYKQKIVPEYKTNRPEPEFDPRPDVIEVLKNIRCTYLKSKGKEADDVMASFCHQNRDKEIVVISSDKDLWQLIGMKHVKVHALVARENITVEHRKKKFGVNKWNKIALWKAIFGDPSDGIKAAFPNVRKKDILPYINKCSGTPKSFYKVVAKAEFTEKTAQKVREGKNDVNRYYKIIKLRKDFSYVSTTYPGNKKRLIQYLKSWECTSIIPKAPLLCGEEV